ncbi:MAG: cytochrome c3 family protein [Candidatus Binatia bacterium]
MVHLLRLGIVVLVLCLLLSVALAVEGDIVFKRPGGEGGTPPAVFPHWVHRIRYKCYACHPGLFEMKAGANRVSMDAIQQGKFCGTCHNGQIAWAVTFESCHRCHAKK